MGSRGIKVGHVGINVGIVELKRGWLRGIGVVKVSNVGATVDNVDVKVSNVGATVDNVDVKVRLS